MENANEKLSRMYKLRFSDEELIIKEKLWKILIDEILQKYISYNDTVLDLGGGECLFINNVRCEKKYIVDLNPDIKKYANKDVVIIQKNADNISDIHDESIDVVFVSNFFEHMKNKDELEKVIIEIKRMRAFNRDASHYST